MQEKKRETEICSHLNGFLEAFSLLNCQVNEGYTFCVDVLCSVGSAEDDLNAYYKKLFNVTDKVDKVLLKQLGCSVDLFGESIFERWLATNWGKTDFTHEQRQLCSDALSNYIKQLNIKIIYEVFVIPPQHVFYEASWQDFALTSKDATYLLHFGVSD